MHMWYSKEYGVSPTYQPPSFARLLPIETVFLTQGIVRPIGALVFWVQRKVGLANLDGLQLILIRQFQALFGNCVYGPPLRSLKPRVFILTYELNYQNMSQQIFATV